jgi:hypothetical protein
MWTELVKWYQAKCDREEGWVKRVVLLRPRQFGLHWPGKKIRVTVETVPDLEDECDLWILTLKKLPR